MRSTPGSLALSASHWRLRNIWSCLGMFLDSQVYTMIGESCDI